MLPAANITATASAPIPTAIRGEPSTPLSREFRVGNSISGTAWSPLPGPPKNASPDAGQPLAPPVYNGLLSPLDVPDSLKEATIHDQTSLERHWESVLNRLQTGTVTEEEVLQILQSGFLQTETGSQLASRLRDTILRSVKPVQGLSRTRLREFVDIICHQPPARWADAFGENVNFPRGRNGEGVQGFIQTQLTLSRLHRGQQIAAGELLDNDTWNQLRDLTRFALKFTRRSSDSPFNRHVRQLEDHLHVRPSPKHAQTLVGLLVNAVDNPDPDERKRWTERFADAARQLDAQLKNIEIVDNRPERSWLEEIVNPGKLQARLSTIATPMNAALDGLGSITVQSIKDTASAAIENAAMHFIFGTKPAPAPAPEPEPERPAESPATESALVQTLLEIERKSSFYRDVITTGPRFEGGVANKMAYVANLLSAIDVPGIVDRLRQRPPTDRLESGETEAPAQPVHANSGPVPTAVAHPSSLEGFYQQINDALIAIDQAFSFPEASAIEIEMRVLDLAGHLESLASVDDHEKDVLLSRAVYGSTVEDAQTVSWWETIGPALHDLLVRLSAGLTLAGSRVAGLSSAGVEVLKDNPGKTVGAALAATTLSALWALYHRYAEKHPDLAPDGPVSNQSMAVTEPAVPHDEPGADAIETLLREPVAEGAPALEDTILQLMYESSAHDLLDDAQLIDEVALLLQQHSAHDPGKTFAELILELKPHAPVAAGSNVHHIRKRDIAAVDKNSPLSSNHAREIEGEPDGATAESHDAERLAGYLETLSALQTPADAAHQDIDDDSSETSDDPAVQVIRLLRHRRSATWSDDSRADGDSKLLSHYTRALLAYADASEPYDSKTITLPVHSSFGRCWLNLVNAFKNPFFNDWAVQAKIDLSTLHVNTADSTLTGVAGGVKTTFTLRDGSGWANVAGPILRSAKVVDPTHLGVAYPSGSSIPLKLVSGFYGESASPDRAQARQRARELSASQRFPEIAPDDPLRPAQLRSHAQVEKQRQLLGDLYAHHFLKTQLADLVKDKPDSAPVNLIACKVAAHRDSLFAAAYPHEAKRMVSAQRFINAMGWTVPKTAGQVRNLIDVLTFALPENTPRGNYRGALGYPRPLSSAQVATIGKTVQQFKHSAASGLLDTLLQHQTVVSPAQGLNSALNSDKARQLGQALEANLGAIPSQDSASEWVMAAMLLDLDATPGVPRNDVAGYSLTQIANLGVKPATVIERLQAHLIAGDKVTANTASVAAYHLLAGTAPEFLVRDLPPNLVCGSHTWTSLRIAVARLEQLDPGISARMTFEQVMAYGNTAPVSVGQDIAAQSASVNPLIDWALANGILVPNASDSYTPAQLDIAREKFNGIRVEMAQAREFLAADVPTREGLALAELERVFGKGLPFDDLCLRQTNIPHSVRATRYSLLDLYVTGQLEPGKWSSYNEQLAIQALEGKFSQLKPAAALFKETFTAYFDNVRSGSGSVFKYLISQLPLEDRQSLEYGRQTFYSVRSEIDEDRHFQTREQIEAHKGRHGILIRSELQNSHTGKQDVTYYEVFPGSVEIRKNSELPETLHLNGKLKTFRSMKDPSGYIEKQCATPQPIDWAAYEQGTAPRSGMTSNVIIEEIKPTHQEAVFYPPDYDFSKVPNAFSANARINHLAAVVVDEHFVVGREQLEAHARGSTNSENENDLKRRIKDFFVSLVPFKSCIENLIQGDTPGAALDCTLDAAGFVIPGGRAIGAATKVAQTAGAFVPRALKMGWIMGSTVVSSANPLDGVGDLFRFGKNVVCSLGSQAYRAAGMGLEQIRSIYVGGKGVPPAELLKRADIAQGLAGTGVPGQTGPVTALFKEGKWFAFDAGTNRPYGSPLEHFLPDSSIALERISLDDGSSPLINTRVFESQPHVIPRSTGTDIVDGDKVYRFDPEHPEALSDINCAAHFKGLDGYEAICRSGKSKRNLNNCFSKVLDSYLTTVEEKRVQAIEHKRLYPTSGEQGVAPRVVHERRIYKCGHDFRDCKPDELTVALQFKSTTPGNVIANEHFGFAGKIKDENLNDATCVVRIGSIVEGIEDAREVRAFKVDIPGKIWGTHTYLVAEADTGLFYYCKYDATQSRVDFKRLDYADGGLGENLINQYHKVKDPYLIAGGGSVNNEFVLLPPLNSLYKSLEANGWKTDDIEHFKQLSAQMTDSQKRDLMVMAMNKHGDLDIEVVIPAIKIEPISKPPLFNSRSASEQNRILAEQSLIQVQAQIKATGLGPANQRIVNDPVDLQRQAMTLPVVMWQYARVDGNIREIFGLVHKTGAGNCDLMNAVALQVLHESGGTGSRWMFPGHTFVVAGVPQKGPVASTIDFSEPAFKDAWILDAWTGSTYPAKDFAKRFAGTMTSWKEQHMQIFATDWNASPPVQRWMDPTDSAWLDKAIKAPKTPSY